jgi:hypothetical protein
MALTKNKLAAATAVAAAFSMLAMPAVAADLPRPHAVQAYDAAAGDAHGWGRGRHHRHDNDIDAGDVLAGVLILGGIAAIASAANNDRDDGYRYPEDPGYRTPAPQPRFDGRGMDRAADICVAEVERRGTARVGSVDSAARTGEGWQVAGSLEGGEAWSCWIDNDGRIGGVEIGAYGADDELGSAAGDGGQWSDEDYARARAAQDGPTPYDTAQTPDIGG